LGQRADCTVRQSRRTSGKRSESSFESSSSSVGEFKVDPLLISIGVGKRF
jgi:hypothetical protein